MHVLQCIHDRMYNFAMKTEFKTNWMSQNDYLEHAVVDTLICRIDYHIVK